MPEPCQVCGSTTLEDYVQHDEGHYLRCPSCGLICNARAEELMSQAGARYDAGEYFAGYQQRLPKKLRAARRRLDLIRSFVPDGRLLDIGCGVGDCLLAAGEAGFDAEGLDVGDYAVQHCRDLGFKVHQASITQTGLPDRSFDVVTMWDVLEHIPRTADGLVEVARVLRPGGIAVIVTPTGEYIKAHLFRQTYQNYRAGWALTHFVYHNRRTLRRVLRDCGFEPQRLPAIHSGAFRRGWAAGAAEVLVAPMRAALGAMRSGCRLNRNLLAVARKQ